MANGPSKVSLVSFNAGEFSPKLDARVDLQKYGNACRELRNAIIGLYGEAERRPGTEYIGDVKTHASKVRLVDFQFSTTTTFTMEFGHQYIRFFSSGARVYNFVQYWENTAGYTAGEYVRRIIDLVDTYFECILDVAGTVPPVFNDYPEIDPTHWVQVEPEEVGIYEVVTPYDVADIFQIQFAQSNDVAYLTHPDYPVYKLSRLGDADWTMEAVEFNVPPLLDENLTDTTITASATSGTGITLTASDPIFSTPHVGSYWQIAHLRNANFVELSITADGSSSTIEVLGDWNVRTYGIWNAEILIERSFDGGTNWDVIRKFAGKEDRNVDATGTQETEALYRVTIQNWVTPAAPGTTTPRVVIEVVDAYIYGLVKVTAFNSVTEVEADVITEIQSTAATKIWAEGAWSDYRGYPRAVTIFEQSLVFGGTDYQPQTVWKSVTGDYENFRYGSKDTDAFAYTIGAKRQQTIRWLVAQKALMIGTTSGEWAMFGSSNGEDPLTPTNVTVKPQSEHGNAAIEAKLVGDVVLFVQRNGRKVRELAYSLERDKYVAPDLTLLAEHITQGGIVQLAVQQLPINILWAVTGDGRLIGMTYERDQDVVGWHPHETDGFVESVAVVYGDGDDEVWLAVRRTINGSTKRYIERFHARFDTASGDEKADAFFVDCGLSYDGAAASTFSGLDHLEGETVAILADGAVVPDQVVTSGAVTLPDGLTATKCHIGLPFTTSIKPMRLDTDPQLGVTQGQVKRIREVFLRFLDTLGCSFGDGKSFEDNLSFRDTADDMDDSPPLFTGDKLVEFDGDYEYEGDIVLKQTQPLPLTLLAIVVKYEVTGR